MTMTYRFATGFALRAVQLALLVEAVIRGWNFIATPSEVSNLYWQIEASAPLWAWGWLMASLGIIGLVGEWWMDAGTSEHRVWVSFVAHFGLAVVFTAFAISAAIGVTQRAPVYGFASVFDMAIFAGGHWLFARRRKRGT